MQQGDTPFYHIRLKARAEQGKLQIEQGLTVAVVAITRIFFARHRDFRFVGD